MYSIHLPVADNLKTVIILFGLAVYLPVTWLIYSRLPMNRIMQQLDSLGKIIRCIPRVVKKFIVMLTTYLLGWVFVGIPVVLLCAGLLTATLVIVNADNTAETHQVFIWDKEYGDIPGAGRFVVNRSDDTLLLLDWKPLGPPKVVQTFPPATVMEIEKIPQSYIPVAQGLKRPDYLSGDSPEQSFTNEAAYRQKLAEMQTDDTPDPIKNALLGID